MGRNKTRTLQHIEKPWIFRCSPPPSPLHVLTTEIPPHGRMLQSSEAGRLKQGYGVRSSKTWGIKRIISTNQNIGVLIPPKRKQKAGDWPIMVCTLKYNYDANAIKIQKVDGVWEIDIGGCELKQFTPDRVKLFPPPRNL